MKKINISFFDIVLFIFFSFLVGMLVGTLINNTNNTNFESVPSCDGINETNLMEFDLIGTSMFPTIPSGSKVLISQEEEISKGDIIAFKYDKVPNGKVLHRVIKLNETHYFTQGDNIRHADGWIPKEDLIGKLVCVKSQ